YAHTDEEAAMANPFFPRRVAHGYLLVSWAAGLFVEPAPGPVLANYGLENLRFIEPVTYDDSIRIELTAKRITPRVTDDYGEVCWDAALYNQDDVLVASYDVLTLVEKVDTLYAEKQIVSQSIVLSSLVQHKNWAGLLCAFNAQDIALNHRHRNVCWITFISILVSSHSCGGKSWLSRILISSSLVPVLPEMSLRAGLSMPGTQSPSSKP